MREASAAWLKKEKVLCIAALCALATMFFVPPGGNICWRA